MANKFTLKNGKDWLILVLYLILQLNPYGALTLCRVGLPSTCRAIKKTQSPERWVLSELVPGRNFFKSFHRFVAIF